MAGSNDSLKSFTLCNVLAVLGQNIVRRGLRSRIRDTTGAAIARRETLRLGSIDVSANSVTLERSSENVLRLVQQLSNGHTGQCTGQSKLLSTLATPVAVESNLV